MGEREREREREGERESERERETNCKIDSCRDLWNIDKLL